MPTAHASLSPSASARWISCPASIRLSQQIPPEVRNASSAYAEEGTLAHTLCEIEAGWRFGHFEAKTYAIRRRKWEVEWEAKDYGESATREVEEHVQAYCDLLEERMAREPHSVLLLEQQMETGVPGCWGTSDAVIVSPTHIEIVDFKYGMGVRVEAKENSQLRLYALGALRTFGDLLGKPKFVYATVFQPRLDHFDTERLTPAELRAWKKDVVLPAALLTDDPEAPFGPSEKACRFCPAAGICRARIDAAVSEDFGEPYAEEDMDLPAPEALTPEEMSRALTRLPEIREWADALETYALSAMNTGAIQVPGWKVVMSSGRRGIKDDTGAIQTLIDAGYNAEDVARFKTRPLGDLERLLGKQRFAELLGPFVAKSPGKECLALEDDPRPGITAADDFAEEPL